MNKAQRNVVLVAAVAVAAMLVFPPWETFGGHYLGHSLLTSPPGFSAPSMEGHGWAFPPPEPVARVSIPLLTLQLAVLWISAGAAILFLTRPRRRGGPP
jgi:hypothetical protein